MTIREITNTFKAMYSLTLISKVIDSVKEQVIEWQNRPLDNLYPMIYLDCFVVKVKQDGSIINKSKNILKMSKCVITIVLIKN